MFILDGRTLSPDAPFKHMGVQYPANWLRLASPEEREAIGIQEVPDPPVPDFRFMWGYTEDGNPIWKDHGQLVDQWSQQTRTTANTLLSPTDWIIIREADNGKAADPLTKLWREDIRLAAGQKITAIKATVDSASLAAYITGAEYPVWPSDPNSFVPPTPVASDGVESAGDGGEG